MPVIRLQKSELKKLEMDENVLIENVAMLGADLKDVSSEEILVEFFPDRPDLYTVEGVVRAMKGFMGEEVGLPLYTAKRSNVEINVSPEMQNIRPYIAGAVIKGLNVDDGMIRSMMDFQEKLHLTVGRKRKKLAIGLHDFSHVKPPFRYVAMPKTFKFVPLGFKEEMTLEEILNKHPKGMEYASILKDFNKYPIILDAEDNVLSFPPIINGTLTQVTPDTEKIFIEITGTDLNVVKSVLNIISCSFADRGGKIETVDVKYPEFEIVTPDLKYESMSLKKEYVEKLLGLKMKDKEIINALLRMRFDAQVKNSDIAVKIPPYRMDILHPVDIVEDIAKGYGYPNFTTLLPEKHRIAEDYGERDRWIREIMIGLGFLEVTTLTITSFQSQYDRMGIPRERFVEIENPITEDGTTLRTWLIPSLMEILQKNRHNDLPQKIFELGYIRKESMEKHLAFVYVDSSANFALCKSLTEAILREMGIKDYTIKEKEHGSFIPGRCARIIHNDREIGFFGEIHPEVLENFQLGYPVIAMEIKI